MNTAQNTNTNSAYDGFLSWEVFLLGGCSIFVCLASWAFTDKSSSVLTMSQLAFGLAFAVNHPHFLSSYNLLYGDFRPQIFKKPRYFWAAVIVPILLGGSLAYSFATDRGDLLGHVVTAMYFLVGWHYVKQVFGCVIVTSARRRTYYKTWERRLILANLFSLWAISWLKSHVGTQSFSFYGIPHQSLNLPFGVYDAGFWALGITGFLVVAMHVRKYIEEGARPSPPGIAALAALYVWYLPAFAHPSFAYLIPFFHSLQYLVFVWSFKRNQTVDHSVHLHGKEQRQAWVVQFVGFAVLALFLGAMAFEFLPKFLDSQQLMSAQTLGASPFLAFFLLFINIHHYFIDNVIWRSDNAEVKKYLFAPPQDAGGASHTHGKARRAA
jgi:hypothetical protein